MRTYFNPTISLYSAILSFLHCDGRLSYYNYIHAPSILSALCHPSCGFLLMILIQVWMAVSISHLLLSHPDVNALSDEWWFLFLGTLFVKNPMPKRSGYLLCVRSEHTPHRHWINFPQGIRGTLAPWLTRLFSFESSRHLAAAVYIQKLGTMKFPSGLFWCTSESRRAWSIVRSWCTLTLIFFHLSMMGCVFNHKALKDMNICHILSYDAA